MGTMTEPQNRYSSYLLRLWKTASDSEQCYRASLENNLHLLHLPVNGIDESYISVENILVVVICKLDHLVSRRVVPAVAGDRFFLAVMVELFLEQFIQEARAERAAGHG